MAKTKADLIEDIKVLNHNLKCKEETIEIQRRRLSRVYKVLEEDGYSLKEINEILKLTEEK